MFLSLNVIAALEGTLEDLFLLCKACAVVQALQWFSYL